MQYTNTESNMIKDTYYCCWHVANNTIKMLCTQLVVIYSLPHGRHGLFEH